MYWSQLLYIRTYMKHMNGLSTEHSWYMHFPRKYPPLSCLHRWTDFNSSPSSPKLSWKISSIFSPLSSFHMTPLFSPSPPPLYLSLSLSFSRQIIPVRFSVNKKWKKENKELDKMGYVVGARSSRRSLCIFKHFPEVMGCRIIHAYSITNKTQGKECINREKKKLYNGLIIYRRYDWIPP